MTRLPFNAPIRTELHSCTIYRPLQPGGLFVIEMQWLHILMPCFHWFIIFIKLCLVFKKNVVANLQLLDKYAVFHDTSISTLFNFMLVTFFRAGLTGHW